MQTQEQIAAPSALERRIDVIVALADVEREVEQRLKRMSKTVKMAGFRPGKVPFKMVAQTYGEQTRSEAIGAALDHAFGEKVREQKLRVAGYPRIEPKPTANDSQLEFSAVFEVYPEVVLGDVSAREIEKQTLVVGDVEVDKTIEALRKQRVTYAAAARPAQKEDRVVIDFLGRLDGTEFPGGKADDFALVLGAGRMLPDFEKGVEGISAGEKRTIDVNFPEDYNNKELAGKTAQFEITCKSVEATQLPPIDAEFARQLGIADGDVAKMRSEVRANLEREVNKRLQQKIKTSVMEILLDVTPVDVPKSLVESESRQMAEQMVRDMEARGMSAKGMPPLDPALFIEPAIRRVKLGLIFAELVKARELHARPEQVKTVVEDFAATFEDPKEVVRWYYSQPQRLAEAEALAVENNVVEWVLATAKTREVPAIFDELMGNAA
ncbi:Trigger factor [Georgfuchsia toluolica]|uniref:Trigger factor n=1 Tax=Georgfuchsia toluolica TaxID=424218 RepID=A0A916J1K1_9PROT|nr:trigger factor [Georgfuchsia toluolica]CAG4882268.1 Trigger factor [Georgfuchsia toluolica]